MKLQITDRGHEYLTSVQYAKVSDMTEDDLLIAEALGGFTEFDGNQLPAYMPLRVKYTLYALRYRKLVELIPETCLEESELILVNSYIPIKHKDDQDILDTVTEAKKLERGDKKKIKKTKGVNDETKQPRIRKDKD